MVTTVTMATTAMTALTTRIAPTAPMALISSNGYNKQLNGHNGSLKFHILFAEVANFIILLFVSPKKCF